MSHCSAKLRQLSASDPLGWLTYGPWRLPCAIGPSGVLTRKREGDGATPAGLWPLRKVLYRPDKIMRPRTCLPLERMDAKLGWCDEPGDPNYNREVALPYPGKAEQLWRNDDVYDLIVILGYNDVPRAQGRGSAIFMHFARPDFAPTAGCIALRHGDLLKLLEAPNPPRWLDTRHAR